MTEYETISLALAAVSAFGSIVSAAAMAVAAVGIWVGIRSMDRANTARAAQAAENRKEMQAQAAEDRKAMRAQAAEDRKAMRAIMAALERQGAALERQSAALGETVRRPAPPQAGSAG